MKSSDLHIRAISQEMPQPSITKICLKIVYLKLHSNLPGSNELKFCPTGPLWRDTTSDRWIPPSQRSSDADSFSMSWHHHVAACKTYTVYPIEYAQAWSNYRQTSNISRTLIGNTPDNKIVDHSDVVGASPVGAGASYIRGFMVHFALWWLYHEC